MLLKLFKIYFAANAKYALLYAAFSSLRALGLKEPQFPTDYKAVALVLAGSLEEAFQICQNHTDDYWSDNHRVTPLVENLDLLRSFTFGDIALEYNLDINRDRSAPKAYRLGTSPGSRISNKPEIDWLSVYYDYLPYSECLPSTVEQLVQAELICLGIALGSENLDEFTERRYKAGFIGDPRRKYTNLQQIISECREQITALRAL